ncbi:hypothetical protein D3C80_1419140 [compost metagenome]
MDVFVGNAVQALLLGGGFQAAADPAARHVHAEAIHPDQVSVERQQVAIAEHPWAGLLEPGVGARAGAEDTGFDPFSAAADIATVQRCPDIVFGSAGTHGLTHFGNRCFTGGHRATHGQDLVGAFDQPGELGDFLAVVHLHTEGVEGTQAGDFDAIHGQAAVIASVGAQ